MKKEFLQQLGLADDAVEKILAEYGKEIETVKSREAQKAEQAAAGLKTAQDTIAGLQEAVKKFDGVDVDKLKAELAGMQDKYDKDISAAKLDAALRLELVKAKSRDEVSVRANLDQSLLKLDGEKILGLEEQLARLKSEKGFLFEPDKPENEPAGITLHSGPAHGAPLEPEPLASFVSSARQAAGLKD